MFAQGFFVLPQAPQVDDPVKTGLFGRPNHVGGPFPVGVGKIAPMGSHGMDEVISGGTSFARFRKRYAAVGTFAGRCLTTVPRSFDSVFLSHGPDGGAHAPP